MNRGECWTLVVFVLTALAWIFQPFVAGLFPSPGMIKDASIAITGALLLFLIPVGVVVEASADTNLPEMSWVRVIGRAEFPMVDGKRSAIVYADTITKTTPPGETMLY